MENNISNMMEIQGNFPFFFVLQFVIKSFNLKLNIATWNKVIDFSAT